MTKMLELMKCTITNALELESRSDSDKVKHYFCGKAVGVLEVAMGGALSRAEYGKLCAHYESEWKRLL